MIDPGDPRLRSIELGWWPGKAEPGGRPDESASFVVGAQPPAQELPEAQRFFRGMRVAESTADQAMGLVRIDAPGGAAEQGSSQGQREQADGAAKHAQHLGAARAV